MSDLPSLALVILNWNSANKTVSCLDAIRGYDYPVEKLKIIVIDNASSDTSKDILPEKLKQFQNEGYKVVFHRHESHPGVTEALNSALSFLSDDDIYVCRHDNDVVMDKDGLTKMVTYMHQNNQIGLMGARTVYTANPALLNSAAIFINRVGLKNKMIDSPIPMPCDAILGCLMLTRVAAIKKIGYWFDKNLLLFAEEPDLSFNLLKQGYTTYYYPLVTVLHETKVSLGKHSELSNYLNTRNHTLIYNKHFPWYSSAVRIVKQFSTYLVKGIMSNDFNQLVAFMDGCRKKPLSKEWWNAQIADKTFKYP